MNAVAIPSVILAGIMFYVGFYHLLLYSHRFQQRADLNFALFCLAMACYDIFSAGLYSLMSSEHSIDWLRLQITALMLGAMFFMWFAWYIAPEMATSRFDFDILNFHNI